MQAISGRIITHDKDFQGTVFFDEAGIIRSVEDGIQEGSRNFGEGCLIFPGFGDVHIHAREDMSGKHTYKEDFLSAAAAGANSGVTHIADMPNNPIPPVDETSYAEKLQLTAKANIHVTLYAGIGPATSPLERNVPYKVFMGPSIGELFFDSNEKLEEAISRYRGQAVSFHCEDPHILQESKPEKYHEDRRPPQAEILAAEFAISLIEKYNLKGKLCHFSTGEGLRSIRKAKAKQLDVSCEVTPTHLFFDRSMINDSNRHWFQMNPPLRTPEDRAEMLAAVLDGTIDFLATDHAPHTIEEKLEGISGIPHLDTYSLFVTWLIVEKKVPLAKIAEICAKNPGDFVRPYLPKKYHKGFGYIEKEYAANFTVLNLKRTTRFTKEMIKSKSGWSVFEDFTFPGSIEAAYFMGKKIK